MNFREFMKKVRSPMGMTLLFLTGIVVTVLAVIPFLLRDDAGRIESIHKNEGKEGTYEIQGTTKEIHSKENLNKSLKHSKAQALQNEKSGASRAITPPTPPRRLENMADSSQRIARAGNASAILIIDGENATEEKKAFVSERYAPYGRLVACKMINTVESGDTDTPLVATVMEDLWWINSNGEKKLIIPSGTEVHGQINGAKPLRNRLTTANQFVLIWQATSDMVGFELQLNAIALEKSTYPDNRMLATISDMSAGIPGQVVSNENLGKFLMYTLAFGQGLAQGFQNNEITTNSSVTILTQEGSTKNAIARGAETLAQTMLQDVSQMIAKESYFIRVPAGTEFYLYVKQVINLDDAKVADTLLNELEKEKIQGGNRTPSSHKNVLNAFSK